MRWLVADTLSTPEQWFGSHLSAYSHFLREYGETVDSYCLNLGGVREATIDEGGRMPEVDVVFALDRYDRVAEWKSQPPAAGARFVAQVAALTNPLPWEVRREDGSPAFDLVISSLRWMVKAAEDAGCRAAWMPLAFDHRALVAGMAVKERDIPCLVLGSLGPNHARRTQLVRELGDLVSVAPPTFGREMFALLARSRSVLNVHAEWARGEANNMRMFEATGMGARLITDGPADRFWYANDRSDESVSILDASGWRLSNELSEASTSLSPQWMPLRELLAKAHDDELDGNDAQDITVARETYIQRVPELVSIVRSL